MISDGHHSHARVLTRYVVSNFLQLYPLSFFCIKMWGFSHKTAYTLIYSGQHCQKKPQKQATCSCTTLVLETSNTEDDLTCTTIWRAVEVIDGWWEVRTLLVPASLTSVLCKFFDTCLHKWNVRVKLARNPICQPHILHNHSLVYSTWMIPAISLRSQQSKAS